MAQFVVYSAVFTHVMVTRRNVFTMQIKIVFAIWELLFLVQTAVYLTFFVNIDQCKGATPAYEHEQLECQKSYLYACEVANRVTLSVFLYLTYTVLFHLKRSQVKMQGETVEEVTSAIKRVILYETVYMLIFGTLILAIVLVYVAKYDNDDNKVSEGIKLFMGIAGVIFFLVNTFMLLIFCHMGWWLSNFLCYFSPVRRIVSKCLMVLQVAALALTIWCEYANHYFQFLLRDAGALDVDEYKTLRYS